MNAKRAFSGMDTIVQGLEGMMEQVILILRTSIDLTIISMVMEIRQMGYRFRHVSSVFVVVLLAGL